MTSVNFRLVTPSIQQRQQERQQRQQQQDGTREALTNSSSEGLRFTSNEVLVKEIETDGLKLVSRVHDLAHELIHAALNDNATGTEGFRCPSSGACDLTGCDLREVPFTQQTLTTLNYLVQLNSRPLGLIALDSVHRTKELEKNHANLHATALAIQVVPPNGHIYSPFGILLV